MILTVPTKYAAGIIIWSNIKGQACNYANVLEKMGRF